MKRIIILMLFLVSASAYAQDFVNAFPEWYNNPPQTKKHFYGVGKGESRTIEIAEQKALLEAKASIAEQVEPAKVKEIKKTTKAKGGKINEEIIQQKVIEVELSDVKVLKKVFMQKGDGYTAFILLEMKKKK